jgi:general secretion pathway protein M
MALSSKDKRALAVGISVLVVYLVVQFGIFPLMEKRKRLEKGIAAREKGLVEMQAMQSRYKEISSQSDTLEQQVSRREQGFSLFSFLETMAARADVKQNIDYMKPSDAVGEGGLQQVMVEMKLKAVTLKQLVDFLDLVESPDKIVELKRISIQENKKQASTLDVIMQVITLVQVRDGEN